MKAHLEYLKYVLRHKWFVFKACLRLGVPLHLAVFHDWTKFTPSEWSAYVRSFYNPDGSKRRQRDASGYYDPIKISDAFSLAWFHHEKHNKHHWGYWVIISGSGGKERFLIQSHGDGYPMYIYDNLLGMRMTPLIDDELGGPNYKELKAMATWLNSVAPEPLPMPEVYAREMVADWVGAGMAINGVSNPQAWYTSNREKMLLHPKTRVFVEELLSSLR